MEYQTLFGKMLTASISLMHWVKLLLLRINLEKIKFMQNITTFYGKTIPQIREKLHRRSSKASQQSWHAQRITIPCTCCAAHHQLWIKLYFVMTSYVQIFMTKNHFTRIIRGCVCGPFRSKGRKVYITKFGDKIITKVGEQFGDSPTLVCKKHKSTPMQADLLSNWTLDTLSQSDHYCVHGIQFLTALVDATDISEVQTLWCKVVFLLSWVGKQPSVPS